MCVIKKLDKQMAYVGVSSSHLLSTDLARPHSWFLLDCKFEELQFFSHNYMKAT